MQTRRDFVISAAAKTLPVPLVQQKTHEELANDLACELRRSFGGSWQIKTDYDFVLIVRVSQ